MKQKVTRKNFYRLSLFRESLLWLLFSCAFGPRSKEKKTPSMLLSFISNMFWNNRGLSIHKACFHSPLILDKSCTSDKIQNFRKTERLSKGPHLSSCFFHITCIAATMLSHTKLRVCPMQGISSRTDDFPNMQFSYVFAAHHTCITY